mgnify:CR=1 FL=1
MSMATLDNAPRAVDLPKKEKAVARLGMNWARIAWTFGIIYVFYALYRVYMHKMAFTVGLDYFEPEFQTYWMSLFWAQISIASVTFVGVCGYMWVTRDRHPELITKSEELRRYFTFLAWIMAFAAMLSLMGTAATESDAAWHQVTIRDTDFTPTHIGVFYLAIPSLIICAAGLFLYVKTRLPMHAKKYFIPLVIALSGPVMILPTVGYNEWGHTFFYAEELFGAPIHWGFATLGLALLALGGVLVHIVSRVSVLLREV